MRWDAMCNVENKIEGFCTYLPTYHCPQYIDFQSGWVLMLVSLCFFNRLKVESLLLQKVQLKTSICNQGIHFFFFQCHGRIRYKKNNSSCWKLKRLHINKEILRARWPIIRRVHGGWKAITALLQLKYSFQTLCTLPWWWPSSPFMLVTWWKQTAWQSSHGCGW